MKTRLRPVQRFLSHPVLMIPMHLWLSDAWLRLGSYHLETMSLKPFTYPFPETRFLHAGPNVYKFKIRYGNSIRGEEIENKDVIIRELEDSIRAVLGNLDNLQPFVTEHFIVFPYKSKWERVSHLKFKHGEIVLLPYPFVFTLYVEMKWFHENLSPGRPINDSPLGLDSGSSLKLLTEKKTAGASVRKRGLVEEPGSPRSTGLRRDKMNLQDSSAIPIGIPERPAGIIQGPRWGLLVKKAAKRSPIWKPGRTRKENPSRRPQTLIPLKPRNRILKRNTACQGQLSHHYSKTTHLHLKS
ncbi:membrane-anchored junction protein isoform X3 [Sciurus carolinensis]|uniref:membrane-anchored junction protein isoform X3 n=1 Tax=Sciurus carolinensis TaxID=30640 RepID=UPI001FB3B189|nr:membrane-anchored junction protein isoform X3 [Sciurus carolinensis]